LLLYYYADFCRLMKNSFAAKNVNLMITIINCSVESVQRGL
jgi:hypothetical protein